MLLHVPTAILPIHVPHTCKQRASDQTRYTDTINMKQQIAIDESINQITSKYLNKLSLQTQCSIRSLIKLIYNIFPMFA